MGCFSYMCLKTNKGVESTSYDGQPVYLFLLENGQVLEYMYGNYDSYGKVLDGQGGSLEWEKKWSDCVKLHFNPNPSSGFAAVLAEYWQEGDPLPTMISDDDPNQGWGDGSELMSNTSDDMYEKVEKPFHKVINHPISPKSWPEQGTVMFSDLAGPLRDVVSQLYTLEKKNPKTIKYLGFDLGADEKRSCLSAVDALAPECLESIEGDQGRDPMMTIISFAIQLGIEQGRRITKPIVGPTGKGKSENELLTTILEELKKMNKGL